jgi:hypothetical protein
MPTLTRPARRTGAAAENGRRSRQATLRTITLLRSLPRHPAPESLRERLLAIPDTEHH